MKAEIAKGDNNKVGKNGEIHGEKPGTAAIIDPQTNTYAPKPKRMAFPPARTRLSGHGFNKDGKVKNGKSRPARRAEK